MSMPSPRAAYNGTGGWILKMKIGVAGLKKLAVISIRSAGKLGTLAACEVDMDTGRILALYTGGARSRCIPWDRVVRVGADALLVDAEDPGGAAPEPCIRF